MATIKSTETQQKIDLLQAEFVQDLEACDLKWTLFTAAAQSYRYDSRLSPYPSLNKDKTCAQNNSLLKERYDIESIRRSINSVPSLDSIDWPAMKMEAIDLLFWVICEQTDSMKIQSIPKEKFADILSKVVSDYPVMNPTHIFQLVPSLNSPAELKFKAQLGPESKSIFAFHGSKMDSFHSIFNHGLQQHLCKVLIVF